MNWEDALASTHYVHVVSDDELQELWGISARELAKLAKRRGFPPPTDPPQGKPGVWRSIPEMRKWLATTGYRTPRQMTLDWWPDAAAPAEFDGAQRHSQRHGREDTVIQRWSTEAGTVAVFWHDDPNMALGPELTRMAPDADAYVLVGADWGFGGPALWSWPGEHPDAPKEEISWRDLARVLGRPAPFWPDRLQIPELIEAWQPGDPPARDVGKQDLDVFPLTRMALQYPPEHVVHRAMIHAAGTIDANSDANNSSDLRILEQRFDNGQLSSDDLIVAALPAPVDDPDRPGPIDPTVVRSGWREVLARTDRLAEQCVRTIRAWDGGSMLPWSKILILRHSPARAEFLDRLEPVEERTAVYAALQRDPSQRGVAMVDPLTDIPVLLPDNPHDDVRALAPQRLPAASPLAEIILDNEIWVRTQDSMLYPAPLDSYAGISWGYGGTGPHTLAALAHRLLADITALAPTVTDGEDTPDGLIKLFAHKWDVGTVITRRQLEDALG